LATDDLSSPSPRLHPPDKCNSINYFPAAEIGVQRRGLGASTEEVGLELSLLTSELFDLAFQLADARHGIAMATLPIAGLLTQFEILTLQVIDPVAQRGHIPTQILQQGQPLGGVVRGATGLSQLAVPSQLALPKNELN
jgi:hypothetical protein